MTETNIETNVGAKPNPVTQLAQGAMWLAVGLLSMVITLGPHRQLYISESITGIVQAGGIVALAAGLFQLVVALRSIRVEKHGSLRIGAALALLIFALPLAMTLLVKPQAFGSATLHRNGFQMFGGSSSDSSTNTVHASGPIISIDDAYKQAQSKSIWTPSIADILLGLDKQMAQTTDKPLATLGFVYREKGMPADKFGLMRYATVHCSAEARPLGVWVTTPHADTYADDTWVWVTGKVEISSINGNPIAQIVADNVQFTEEPTGPYIFYNSFAFNSPSTP